jgi:polyhydroxybutyrate depolymerase
MRNPRLWCIAVILFVILSGCTRRSSVPVTPSDTASAPVAAAGCGKAAPTAPGTTIEATITSDGMQRTYRLHIPKGYDSNHPTPLVLDIHGHDETALQEERYTLYSVLADQQHFLVVYPQGVIGPDGQPGWATYGKNSPTVNDLQFFSDLLTALQQQLCVDTHRIYATGISNGGAMTNLLTCRMADRIAAFAPVAAAIYPIPGGCHPSRPVAYLEFHGTSDPLVAYNGNTLLQFQPVMQTMQDWAARDGCASGPTTFFQQADVTGLQWTNCQGGVIVEHYRIDGGGHTWPGSPIPVPILGKTTHTISATMLGWQFFQRYTLP